jgi:hypothetical protein
MLWQRGVRVTALALAVLVIGGNGGGNLAADPKDTQPWVGGRMVPYSLRSALDFLKGQGIKAVVADYWVAYRLAFESQETVIATPFRGDERYRPYTRFVERADRAAYLLLGIQHERVELGEFTVYYGFRLPGLDTLPPGLVYRSLEVWEPATARFFIGGAYRAAGLLARALPYYKAVVTDYEAALQSGLPSQSHMLDQLVSVYQALEQKARARAVAELRQQVFTPPHRGEVTFADEVRLLGYALPRSQARPGERISAVCFWQGLRELGGDYELMVSLSNGRQLLSGDHHFPLKRGNMGEYRTSQWIPGEVVRDESQVRIPPRARPGIYELWVTLRDPERRGKQLPITTSELPIRSHWAFLTRIEVLER